MPILATGILTKQPRGSKISRAISAPILHSGFTLLEILVVLVMIGILVGAATLTIHRNPHLALQQETERLNAVMRLAQEQAILRAEVYGVRFEPTGYAFLRRVGSQWQAFTEPPYQAHTLPEVMQWVLSENHYPAALFPDTAAAEEQPPQIVLLPSGEMTPFVLELHSTDPDLESGERYRLEGSSMGELKLQLTP